MTSQTRRKKLWSLMCDDEIREWIFSLGKMGETVNDVLHRIKEQGYTPPGRSKQEKA